MAKSINKVTILGNLGGNPDMSVMASGKSVAKFSIATSQEWTDKTTGEEKKLTEWHDVVAFDKLAELVGKYLTKGDKAHVEGYLKTNKWTDDKGIMRYSMQIIAKEIVFLAPKPQQAAQQPAAQNMDLDDDIPF